MSRRLISGSCKGSENCCDTRLTVHFERKAPCCHKENDWEEYSSQVKMFQKPIYFIPELSLFLEYGMSSGDSTPLKLSFRTGTGASFSQEKTSLLPAIGLPLGTARKTEEVIKAALWEWGGLGADTVTELVRVMCLKHN